MLFHGSQSQEKIHNHMYSMNMSIKLDLSSIIWYLQILMKFTALIRKTTKQIHVYGWQKKESFS